MDSVLSYVISPITYLSSSVAGYLWYNKPDNHVMVHSEAEIISQKEKLQNIGQVYLTAINTKDEYEPERVVVEKIYEEKVVELPAESVNVSKIINITDEQRQHIKTHMKKTQFRMSIDVLLAGKDALHHVEPEVKKEVEKPKVVDTMSNLFSRINNRQLMDQMENVEDNWSDEE